MPLLGLTSLRKAKSQGHISAPATPLTGNKVISFLLVWEGSPDLSPPQLACWPFLPQLDSGRSHLPPILGLPDCCPGHSRKAAASYHLTARLSPSQTNFASRACSLLPRQQPCAFGLTLTCLSGSHGNSGLTRAPKSSICLNVEEAAASH